MGAMGHHRRHHWETSSLHETSDGKSNLAVFSLQLVQLCTQELSDIFKHNWKISTLRRTIKTLLSLDIEVRLNRSICSILY